MTTALDIITDALQRIGVYATGETLSAADSATGLTVLNDMLDSWSNESLICYARSEQSVILTPGKYQYTIGTTGSPDINATRPLRVLDGYGSAYITDTNNNIYNVDVLNQDEWNAFIGNRVQTNSDIPSKLFYDPQFPLGIVNVFPVPIIGYTLTWGSELQLSEFTSLQASLSLPPGYSRALKTNLAIEIGPYFKGEGWTPAPALARAAAQSLGNIKRTNIKEVVAVYDPELVSRASPTYNIRADRQGF